MELIRIELNNQQLEYHVAGAAHAAIREQRKALIAGLHDLAEDLERGRPPFTFLDEPQLRERLATLEVQVAQIVAALNGSLRPHPAVIPAPDHQPLTTPPTPQQAAFEAQAPLRVVEPAAPFEPSASRPPTPAELMAEIERKREGLNPKRAERLIADGLQIEEYYDGCLNGADAMQLGNVLDALVSEHDLVARRAAAMNGAASRIGSTEYYGRARELKVSISLARQIKDKWTQGIQTDWNSALNELERSAKG
ncbi:MAG TPA: hypothetical protein VNQ79_05310 [Blastocatellia bacterium]|nr:hypothetical protein [Blastocatellia bacterium]